MDEKITPAVVKEETPAETPLEPTVEKPVEKAVDVLPGKIDECVKKMDELIGKMDVMKELFAKPEEPKVEEAEKSVEPVKEPVPATEVAKEALPNQDLPAEKTLEALVKLTDLVESYGKKSDGLKDTIMGEVKKYIDDIRVPDSGKANLKKAEPKEEVKPPKSVKEAEARIKKLLEETLLPKEK